MLKHSIQQLISADRIGEAFERLLAVTRNRNEEQYKHLIVLLSRHNASSIRNDKGALSYEQFGQEYAKTISALLSALEEIAAAPYFSELTEAELDQEAAGETVKSRKLLFLASQPKGLPRFELEKEYLDIRRIFRKKRDQFEITENFRTTLDDLYEVIHEERPHIIHMAVPSTDNYLVLHKANDEIHAIPYSLLAPSFSLFRRYAGCIFMNTFTSPVFLKRVSRYFGYALGWEALVADELNVFFSAGYYTAVAQGQDVEQAFATGVALLDDYQGVSTQGIDSILLFKNGVCVNKPDDYPEDFTVDGYSIDEIR